MVPVDVIEFDRPKRERSPAAPLESLWSRIEALLPYVEKPARYIGGEQGARTPVHGEGRVAWLLCYPDTYEIGLPNQGLQILYELLNDRDDALAERSYAPWVDMESAMRAEGVPLFSVENHLSARAFDVLAFNLSAELVYTNVLNMIDLAGLPVRSSARRPSDLIVVAGGHCVFNPEPLADFVDAFVVGDGEEVVGEVNEVVGAHVPVETASARKELMLALATIPGVYVPSLYRPRYEHGRLVAMEPLPGAPAVVEKRTISDLGQWPYPRSQLVPITEVVHDRLNVEVFRGCTRGCRFCQAGMVTRPVRERPAHQVRAMIEEGLSRTGYEEVALTSLSTADYSGIEQLVRDVIGDPRHGGRVSVSLPSLRVDAFTVGTAAEIQRVRRTGLTFAPEGGTWRMRKVINKLISEEDLYGAVDAAFSQGWRRVKLYFLIGLPTERDEDVTAIAELGARCAEIGHRYHRSVTVVASVGGFVPKPQTPFQWASQDTAEELRRKIALIRGAARGTRGLTIRWHDPEASVAEGIASRGDRRVGAVVERVWRAGGTFQEWSEQFDLGLWQDALAAEGLSLDEVVHRGRDRDECLPWAHISAGLHPDFLWGDWQEALSGGAVEDCRWTPCYDCGTCTGFGLEHVVASARPPAGGSQGTGQNLEQGGRVPVHLVSARR
jgi:radical SAM family uncharacterized protein